MQDKMLREGIRSGNIRLFREYWEFVIIYFDEMNNAEQIASEKQENKSLEIPKISTILLL